MIVVVRLLDGVTDWLSFDFSRMVKLMSSHQSHR
jgi:hypothetical protein